MGRYLPSALLVLLACTPGQGTEETGPTGDTGDTGEPAWVRPEGGRIELESVDGLTLVADYYPASRPGRPAVILLHDPLDRSNWPMEFILLLHGHDWTVLVPDLRGWGESEGEPEDSAGVMGIHDVRTLAGRVKDDGYPEFALLAAYAHDRVINGYAYQVRVGTQEGPMPAAMGYLTTTRESFQAYAQLDQLPVLPSIFAYGPAGGYDFVDQLREDAPESWVFYDTSPIAEPGTLMFQHVPELPAVIEEFYLGLWPD